MTVSRIPLVRRQTRRVATPYQAVNCKRTNSKRGKRDLLLFRLNYAYDTIGIMSTEDRTESPWTTEAQETFESKSFSKHYDPCQEAANKSIKCMHRNIGNKDLCNDYFQFVLPENYPTPSLILQKVLGHIEIVRKHGRKQGKELKARAEF